jgi:hypothetical protein
MLILIKSFSIVKLLPKYIFYAILGLPNEWLEKWQKRRIK